MDSMRSLNTSLPRSPRKRGVNPPPEQLIQSFKSAALSVTNLYKTAAADQTRARDAGYQDALDDILSFLDQRNLGLDDGEGWKVRQWATGRLDGSPPAVGSDSDDDRGETVKRARSSSPIAQSMTVQEVEQARQPSRSTSPVRAASIPMAPPPTSQPQNNLFQAPEVFTFRSGHPYPHDIDMQAADTTNSDPQPEPLPSPAVRVEVVPRGSRTPHRGSNHQTRHSARSTASARTLGSGAGSKRRLTTFGDYFDLGSLGDGKDGRDGSGKRARFT